MIMITPTQPRRAAAEAPTYPIYYVPTNPDPASPVSYYRVSDEFTSHAVHEDGTEQLVPPAGAHAFKLWEKNGHGKRVKNPPKA